MSEYTFLCWNQRCGDTVDRDWGDVEDDVTGRMAYCSDDCFAEDCKREATSFNANRSMTPPYVVGDSDAEARLFSMLQSLNPYIAHSIEEEEVDTFSGNWHYLWVPDLADLRAFAEEDAKEGETVEQVMAEIDYTDWEEFLVFTHPVKGIALIRAWDQLQSRAVSVYVSKDQVVMETKPSASGFVKDS